jgi:polyisoprenoid-binding protein YceI
MTNETKWSIDLTHSEITFKVKHLMIANVRGTFKKFDADIRTTGNDFSTAVIGLWIDPASVDTNDEKRDEHLKNSDFFDVLNFKEISFVARTISNADAHGVQEMWGELTIKGCTKNIKLDVISGGIIHDPWGNERAGFSITGKINRKDWKLIWNNPLQSGGVLVGEEISITCEMEFIKSKDTDAVMELAAEAHSQN